MDDSTKNIVNFYFATMLTSLFVTITALGWPVGIVTGLIVGHYSSKYFIQKSMED